VAAIADDPILTRLRRALDALYGGRIERVVLFGSRVRGDAGEDSDYDIAVFLRDLAIDGRSSTGWPTCDPTSSKMRMSSSTPGPIRPGPIASARP
jgi:hypothetical protein